MESNIGYLFLRSWIVGIAICTLFTGAAALRLSHTSFSCEVTQQSQHSKEEFLPLVDEECPEWTRYENHLYCVISSAMEWEQASRKCHNYSVKASLVTIETKVENEFILRLFRGKRLTSAYDAWIGLNDIREEGTWSWHGDGPVVFSNWNSYGDPNGGIGSIADEDCVALSAYFDGTWFDDECGSQHYLICEYK